jgi:hypothetical protein
VRLFDLMFLTKRVVCERQIGGTGVAIQKSAS